MPKRSKQSEISQVVKIYKIAGLVLVSLIIIGVIASVVMHYAARPSVEKKVVQDREPKAVEIVTLNETIEAVEQNLTNMTVENVTQNISIQENVTVENITNQTTINMTNGTKKSDVALSAPRFPLNWSSIKIQFPETLKRVGSNANNFEYINVTEADRTPVSNGEQFKLEFTLFDPAGRPSFLLANYERDAWLLKLLLTNKGKYWLKVTVTCADKKGYCQRFYDTEGHAENSYAFEVV